MKKNTDAKLKEIYKRKYEKQCLKAEKLIRDKKKISKALRKARKIIERLRNIPKWESLVLNICNLCDLLSDYFDGNYPNLPLATIVAIVGGLLYVVLPIDALPDVLPLIGWVDDAAVLAFVVTTERNDVSEYLDWRKSQAISE